MGVIGVGLELAVGPERGVVMRVVTKLGEPETFPGFAEAVDVLIVVHGAEEGRF